MQHFPNDVTFLRFVHTIAEKLMMCLKTLLDQTLKNLTEMFVDYVVRVQIEDADFANGEGALCLVIEVGVHQLYPGRKDNNTTYR